MLYKIIINVILSICIFLYGMDHLFYFENVKYSIVISLISIGLSTYVYYILKNKNEKILLVNIIYMMIVTYIYPPAILLLGTMASELILMKKQNQLYIIGLILTYIFVLINLPFDYNMIIIGIFGSIFIYSILNYEEKINSLKKINYDLKDKNYALEEKRKIEKKISYENMESIKIEERSIISQKLHDKIGHTLAGSIMQLEALKIVINDDKDKGLEILDTIADNLRSGMDDIRNTLRMIKPDQGEININKLKFMLDEFTKKSSVKTSLNIEGDLEEINLVYWKAILDSLREILTNTIKYSSGTKLDVHISILNKIIRVHIKDDGIYKNEIKKGMGLMGIEERIVNLGGDVYFNNEDGFSNLLILRR